MVESVKKFINFIGTTNTTALRIIVTIGMSILTMIAYFSAGLYAQFHGQTAWEPSNEWLMFLAGMAGIDVAQFFAKRKTYDAALPTKQNKTDNEGEESEASTDLEELRNSDKG